MSEYYGFDVGSGYAFQAPGWKQSDFLLCDLQEVVRQSDQAMVDALQRIRFGDYTAIEYFSKNARKKPFSSEEGVVYLCGKNRTAERINDVRVSKLSGKERTYEAEITGQVTEQDKQAPELLRLKKKCAGGHAVKHRKVSKRQHRDRKTAQIEGDNGKNRGNWRAG